MSVMLRGFPIVLKRMAGRAVGLSAHSPADEPIWPRTNPSRWAQSLRMQIKGLSKSRKRGGGDSHPRGPFFCLKVCCGSNSEVWPPARQVRSTPGSRHRQATGWVPAGELNPAGTSPAENLCPLLIAQRTQLGHRGMSEKCQLQTHAPQQTGSLFDHLVGSREERRRYAKAERLGGLRW
jgi:hypothetical protein